MSDQEDVDQAPAPHVERPRFLATTGRHGNYKRLPPTSPTDLGRWQYVESDNERADDLGYTSSPVRALTHEPECVGPAILGSYADVNRRIYTQQHLLEVAQAQERRPELDPENRLRDVHRRAKDAHVDMSHEIHLVQKAIDKAQLRGQPVNPRALERLEGLEALLDGVSVLRMAA